MSEESPAYGTIGWVDLTVANAPAIRDFYAEVVGWTPSPVAMEGYDDFNMVSSATGEPAAGVCHARGENAAIPPQWLIYIVVPDVAASVAKAIEKGGQLIAGDPQVGKEGGYCVVRDPGGAAFALYQPGRE